MSKIEDVKVLVETGNSKKVAAAVQEALDAGDKAQDILDAMVVGGAWSGINSHLEKSLFQKC